MFGIPGAKIDKVFLDTLVDSSIQIVVCRHEQNAAFIAGGIGRMTGKAGVAIATSGLWRFQISSLGWRPRNTEGDPWVIRSRWRAVPVADRLKKIHQSLMITSIFAGL